MAHLCDDLLPSTGSSLWLCRRFAEEQELISAEFKGKREASDAEYDAQLTSLHEEAQKDAARRYAAAGQCKQQAHKLEQVPLVP